MPISKIERAGMPGGAVLQVVSTTKSDTWAATFNSDWRDVTGLVATITPTSSTSKILVLVQLVVGVNNNVHARIVRNGTAVGVGDAAGSRAQATITDFYEGYSYASKGHISFMDSPASSSALTYQVQLGGWSTYTNYVNRSGPDDDAFYRARAISTITLMEIAA